ncbi:unnamed protein product [Heligmosomoides polygyrus]|uniref:Serine/arginine repetitive matrix protein 2-like n=1 Tax=Heligmosomoides polygyrus TaxID=6339 RepID=A0A183FSF9_HELPZ|nr:unnamed protein product [Heligmosomoides polygyrus]
MNDVLRSRARRKIPWDRKEFMSSNFRVRVEHPDGSTTSEVLPYPEVKRRFPAALFEFLESRMPPPRVRPKDEPRADGLLPVYNNVSIPRCVYKKQVIKKDQPEAEPPAPQEVTASTADPSAEVSPTTRSKLASATSEGVPLKDTNGRRRRKGKKRAYVGLRRPGPKGRLPKRKVSTRKRSADNLGDPNMEESIQSVADSMKSMWTSSSDELEVTIKTVPGISPRCAKDFLKNIYNPCSPQSPLSQKTSPVTTPSKRPDVGQRFVEQKFEEMVVIKDEPPEDECSNELPKVDNVRRSSRRSLITPPPRSKAMNNSGGKENREDEPPEDDSSSELPKLDILRKSSRRSLITPPSRTKAMSNSGSNENREGANLSSNTRRSGSKAQEGKVTMSKKRRRSGNDIKSPGCKRNTPLRPRNSLENYFIRQDIKPTPDALHNSTNQRGIRGKMSMVRVNSYETVSFI